MSQTDPVQQNPLQEQVLPATEAELLQRMKKAFEKFCEQIAPWLFEVGSWSFGGLIAFNLLVMASLFTIRPIDTAIKVATTVLALALPLNVTGLILLRLVQDMKHIGFEEQLVKDLQDVGFPVAAQIPIATAIEKMRKRRTVLVLGSSLGILALSGLLTLIGMLATLWHMAWWIAVAFGVMVLLSFVIVIPAITSQPPDSPEAKAQKRRYWEEVTGQANEREQKVDKEHGRSVA